MQRWTMLYVLVRRLPMLAWNDETRAAKQGSAAVLKCRIKMDRFVNSVIRE